MDAPIAGVPYIRKVFLIQETARVGLLKKSCGAARF